MTARRGESRITPEQVAKLTPSEVQEQLLETRALIADGDERLEALVDDFALLASAFSGHTQAAVRSLRSETRSNTKTLADQIEEEAGNGVIAFLRREADKADCRNPEVLKYTANWLSERVAHFARSETATQIDPVAQKALERDAARWRWLVGPQATWICGPYEGSSCQEDDRSRGESITDREDWKPGECEAAIDKAMLAGGERPEGRG